MRTFEVGAESSILSHGVSRPIYVTVGGKQHRLVIIPVANVQLAKRVGMTPTTIAKTIRNELDTALNDRNMKALDDMEFLTIYAELGFV